MQKFFKLFLCSIMLYAANVMSQTATQCVIDCDFEDGASTVAFGSGWNSWATGTTRVWADGDGYGGGGALAFTNPDAAANAWSVQLRYELVEPLTVGVKYYLSFMAKASAEGSISMAMQSPTYAACGDFGSIDLTEEWQLFELETTINNENAEHLMFNVGLLAGTVLIDDISLCYAVEPVEYECVINFDFDAGAETVAYSSGWNSWATGTTREWADGDGYGGGGALAFTNPDAAANAWSVQFRYELTEPLTVGEKYYLTLMAKASVEGSISMLMQSPSYAGCGEFGSIDLTEEWQLFKLETTITDENALHLMFNAGLLAGTIFIDDISLCYEIKEFIPPVIKITAQPAANTIVAEGIITGSLTVAAEVTEGATPNFQWYRNDTASNKDGEEIENADDAEFEIPVDLTEGTYYFYCVVSAEGATSVTSNVATVIVAVHGTIIGQPAALTNVLEGRIKGELSVDVFDGGGELSYQWYVNNTESNEGGSAISDATEATFGIPADLAKGTYYYYCEVSIEGSSSVSNVAKVMVWANIVLFDFEEPLYSLGDKFAKYSTATGSTAEQIAQIETQMAKNIAEVAPDPAEESGQVLLLHGTNEVAGYGLVGIQFIPEFEIVLPEGKTLIDYESLQLDMYFTTGVENGSTNPAATGWFGGGMRINIDGGFTDDDDKPLSKQADYDNANTLGSAALGYSWKELTWARGITMPLTKLNLPPEYQSLTEFKLRVGTMSGATKYWMDNVTLVERMAALQHGNIIRQPAALTYATEGRISGELSVVVFETDGGGTLSYQWYESDSETAEDGVEIPEATSEEFTLPADLTIGTYYYYCVVSVNGVATDVSNVATVIVRPNVDCIFGDDFESYAEDEKNWNEDGVLQLPYKAGDGWNSWGGPTDKPSSRGLTLEGEGYGDEGYALWFKNQVITQNSWDVQMEYRLTEPLEVGGDFKFSFWVKADIADVEDNDPKIDVNVQAPTMSYANRGSFGSFTLTEEWQFVELKTTITGAAADQPIFNLGHFIGTIYFDDVNFCYTDPIIRITTQPEASTTVGEGSVEASVKVVATITQDATINYQWYENDTESNKGGTAISGATDAEFTLPADLKAGTYFYYCVLSNSNAEAETDLVTSRVATVNVLAEGVPIITITTQPEGGTVKGGGALTIEAEVTEDAELSYQWFSNTSNSNIDGTEISGATDAEFTIPSKVGTFYFYCVVNASGEVADAEPKTSVVVTVVVEAVIEITTQPANTTATAGNAASVTVVAEVTEGATLSYQWYNNTAESATGGNAVPGATNASYSTSIMLSAGTYYYYCVVSATNGAEPVTTDVATIVISSVSTGVSEIFGAAFKVYPNPFNGAIRIEGAEGATILVINSAGTAVHVQMIANADETVNLEKLPAGIYLLRLEKDKKATAVTIIKN